MNRDLGGLLEALGSTLGEMQGRGTSDDFQEVYLMSFYIKSEHLDEFYSLFQETRDKEDSLDRWLWCQWLVHHGYSNKDDLDQYPFKYTISLQFSHKPVFHVIELVNKEEMKATVLIN